MIASQSLSAGWMSFKPIPDEEGTEIGQAQRKSFDGSRFKPIPDEEGTEMLVTISHPTLGTASNRSPMRRGLKCREVRALGDWADRELQTDPR